MFNLTRQERQVVLFLIATALFGIGANFFFKRYCQAQIIAEHIVDARESGLNQISLNQAGLAKLISVPGIGPKTAERIILYRDQYGYFTQLEQLKEIKGIADLKYQRIKDYFTIE